MQRRLSTVACGARGPRVLFVSCHRPWPAISGGRRREWELLQRVSRDYDVHLLVVSKTEDDRDVAGALEQTCASVEVHPARPSAYGGRHLAPEQVLRHRCASATRRVNELVHRGEVDLVHVEGYYLMQHVAPLAPVPVVLVEQNIEYELAYQRASVADAAPERTALFAHALRTRAAELRAWRRATRLATVTAEDRALIEAELPASHVYVVPDGADHLPALGTDGPPPARPPGPLVVFVANFAYAPNVDAAQHLCRDILPALRRAVPEVEVWLVGNAPPREVRALADPGVTVTGRVDDIAGYLDVADVVVCPLRIGGGIKVKTLEALRRGAAIVATPIGVQGLPEHARAALTIEAEPGPFAAAVAELLRDGVRRQRQRDRARAAALRLPSWDDAAAALSSVYADALRPRGAAVAALAGERHASARNQSGI